MNNDCEKCQGKCCVGIIDVYSQDEIYYDETLVCEDPSGQFDRMMRTVDMRCIALKDGKCSIYEKRPSVCREFQVGNPCCVNFQSGKITIHSCNSCYVSDVVNKSAAS